jgi:plastocyanin
MTHPSSTLRRSVALFFAALLTIGAAACTSGGGASPGATVSVTDGAVTINSDNLAFDVGTIQAPSGTPFTVTLNNLEGQPHNFAVYTREGGDVIVQGSIITGPDASTVVDVPALEPGTYYFQCDVHPDMKGSIVVSG